MNSYESVIIVNSSLSEETLNKIVKRSEDFISKNGGKLAETIQWGKRRLAYPIKKFQYGYYFIFKFEASPEIISEFEREFRLDENILRFMTFLRTPKELLAEQKLRELEARRIQEKIDEEAEEEFDEEIAVPVDAGPAAAEPKTETVTEEKAEIQPEETPAEDSDKEDKSEAEDEKTEEPEEKKDEAVETAPETEEEKTGEETTEEPDVTEEEDSKEEDTA
ncbi:30S ribosomal protein S6 [candidate division KSB1 bacterium]